MYLLGADYLKRALIPIAHRIIIKPRVIISEKFSLMLRKDNVVL